MSTTLPRQRLYAGRYLRSRRQGGRAFTRAFIDHLASLPELPDAIHAHCADAAEVALEARRRFGIPVV